MMSPNFPALLEAIIQNWYHILILIGILVYSLRAPIPLSRGIWRPSIITLAGTIICIVSFFSLVIHESYFIYGAYIYIIGVTGDLLDGRTAREYSEKHGRKHYTSFRAAFFAKGRTDYGALWDSTNDKIKAIPVLFYVGWDLAGRGDFFLPGLIAMMIVIDGASGVRKLFKFESNIVSGSNHSGKAGKAKTFVQQLSLIPWMFLDLFGDFVLFVFLLAALILTFLSVGNHLRSERYEDIRQPQ
jgi:phosphatidylglycerophosphate synthase